MGGVTQKMLETEHQLTVLSDELDKVSFMFDFISRGNISLLDSTKLHDQFEKEIAELLLRNGVKSCTFCLADGGGGGLGTLWEIIKVLWENKDIIMFASSLFYFVKGIFIQYERNSVKNLYPIVVVVFKITSESELENLPKDEISSIVSKKLANLLVVANGVLEEMKGRYKPFKFDIFVEVRINSMGFYSSYSARHEQRLIIENKFLRFIKDLKVIPGKKNSYHAMPLNFIRRVDRVDKSGSGTSNKKYYFWASTKTVADQFER